MRYLLLVVLLSSSCAQRALNPSSGSPNPNSSVSVQTAARPTFDEITMKDLIKKKQFSKPSPSEFLIRFLIDAKVPFRRNRVGAGRVWEVRDLTCRILMEAQGKELNSNTICEGIAVTGQFPKLKYQSFRYKGELAEEMRSWLFDWPLRQGDPGVTVSWFNCGEIGDGSRNCDLALDLGYSGP